MRIALVSPTPRPSSAYLNTYRLRIGSTTTSNLYQALFLFVWCSGSVCEDSIMSMFLFTPHHPSSFPLPDPTRRTLISYSSSSFRLPPHATYAGARSTMTSKLYQTLLPPHVAASASKRKKNRDYSQVSGKLLCQLHRIYSYASYARYIVIASDISLRLV